MSMYSSNEIRKTQNELVHCLSKFELSVLVDLKKFLFCGVYSHLLLDLKTFEGWLNHHLMANI